MTRIGLLLTQDNAIDPELWEWCPPGVSLHITRFQVPNWETIGGPAVEQAQRSDPVVQAAVRTLTMIEPEVIGFVCTSSSFVNGFDGEAEIRASMLAAGAKQAVTTSGAVVEALQALGVRRVAVGTPYHPWLGDRLRPFLLEGGFEVASLVHQRPERLDLATDDQVAALAGAAYTPGADAMFLSCTALRTRHLVRPLSDRFGMPVITAAQALMWAVLRRAGIEVSGGEHSLRGVGVAAR